MKSTVDILIGLWHFTWQVAMGIYPPLADSNLWILCSVWRKTQKNGKILIFAQRMSAEKLNMHNKHIIKKVHLLTAGQHFKSQILGTLFRREQASKVQQEQKMIFRIKNSYSQKKKTPRI